MPTMRNPRVNVARWLPSSCVNGPGERFVLWVQGCGFACDGCWNPDTWSFEHNRLMTAEALAVLVEGVPSAEGITLTGGEPFLQARALIPFVKTVRARGLSVVAFTGFRLEELRSADALELMALCDVLVAGRYVRPLRATALPLLGSTNQRVEFVTDRYRPSDLEGLPEVEVWLDGEGGVVATGFPSSFEALAL